MTVRRMPGTYPRKRKFVKGGAFKNTAEAATWIENGKWCYWGSVPKHPSVVSNFSLTTIRGAVRTGHLRPAFASGG